MTEIRRPPVLAVCHQRMEVLLQRFVVQLLELFGVIERLAHGIGLGEFWRRILTFSCFGHQLLFDLIPTFVVPCTTGHFASVDKVFSFFR